MKDIIFKIIKYLRWKASSLVNRPGKGTTLAVPGTLRPIYHSRYGYHGPWIENYFYGFWCRGKNKLSAPGGIRHVYIPIFWTDYYIKHDRWHPNKELQAFVDDNLRAEEKYFTIVQNADGIIEKLPGNVLVFGAGGVGDIPIPLLKGDLRGRRQRERDIRVSFMGNIAAHDVRRRMHDTLKGREGYHFGQGTIKEFIEVTERSVFTLCPRGYGRTSYRLYEAMALGSIPVYIWDDVEWLPYKDRLDWNDFSVSLNIKDIGKLPGIIGAHTPEMIRRKQEMLKELRDEYFTMEGVCRNMIRMLKERA
jgi:hypothetical protein